MLFRPYLRYVVPKQGTIGTVFSQEELVTLQPICGLAQLGGRYKLQIKKGY